MVTEAQMETYRTLGYFFADDAVEPDVLGSLLEAANRMAPGFRKE